MRTLLQIFLILVGIPTIALILFFNLTVDGMCGNTIYSEAYSPDGRYKAVIFQRDCGATTDISTQVSIIKMNTELKNDSGNVFVVKGPPDLKSPKLTWVSNTELLIDRQLDGTEFRAEKSMGVINKLKISYAS